ncbi:unnamed protein product [Oppiella nova]|uniref:Small subunit processome component 20 homolog n=1 Tax=Oppiella nova TaxID=334625 RepID=A0A7R9QCE3_9ACAR|nr:unnamed protein product [Oppiella nova]CAG2162943.1 unnamed protein product [Oppiella nova]
MNSQLIFGQNSKEDIRSEVQTNESPMEMDSNESVKDSSVECHSGIGRKVLWKSFFSFLGVLSKFKNPKALYRDKELTNICLNLLSSPDSELQKNAFNCIISYKYSYLDGFHDNFLRLIDEKTFKSEINSLILNSEDEKNVLQAENRSMIIPILMRILYGKMMATNGTKRHGKNSADFRRSIILKVLSAFNQNELILFLDLIFAPIIEFVGHDYQTLDESIKTKLSLKECIPLRQLQAMIKTLDFVLKHLGNNSQAITAYIFKVLVVISTFVSQLLSENRDSINDHSIIRLKDIRSNCLKIGKIFFETFDAYDYSSIELDALFEGLKTKDKKGKKSKTSAFSSQELTILSRLSAYVSQSDESFKLIILLINSFDLKRNDEQKELQTMQALSHLVKNVAKLDVTHVLRSLVPLFGIIRNSFSRTQLCHTFETLAQNMAIRESALDVIRNVLKKFEEFDDNYLFNVLVIKLLLYSTISKGLRNKSESIRHQMIELLVSLIEINGQRHVILKQLSLLCNKEDEEIDFWLNIKHIQIHRRTRALNRFAKNEDLLKSLSNKIFSDFLIPLTTNFLKDVQYSKQTALMNASVEAIGAFSKHIHWNKYYFILKYYVNQLIQQKGDQKMNIKVISSILDNFSFDASNRCNEEEIPTDEEMETNVKSLNTSNVLPSNDKIYDSAVNHLLPLLHKCLHQKSQIDYAFDSMKNEYSEDDEIQRVPIALAIINQQVLKSNISSVFLRLCQFLQSRTQSIRDLARNTFVKVMECLGPKYVANALKEMRSSLSKGYQRHVFVYSVYTILASLRPQLKCGDLDNCLDTLLEVCSLELFGNLSEEKEVSQITTKLKEAKKCKTTVVSQDCLPQLLAPLKTTLLGAHNHKVVRKVSQSLSKVGQGLVSNSGLTHEALIKFIYDLTNDTLLERRLKLDNNLNDTPKKSENKRIDSRLIVKPIYQRSEKVSKIGETSNSHVIIEFALIKQKRIQTSNEEHLALLDPFIPLLETILDSKDAKLATLSLQSLFLMYTKFSDLPAFATHSESIMKTIFVLLNKYAKFGISDREDDNVQLVVLCFKTLSLFIKDRTDVHINDEQMAVLLSYVDQDLHNDSHQSTVFIILKSIIHRKYSSHAFHRIMKNVTEMSITSQIDSVRSTCSQLCVKYLTEYSQANHLTKRINFFIRHLEYEKTSGRESALYVLNHLISELSYEYLRQNIAVFFVPLSSRLVNETESEAKKLVADSLTKLLRRLTQTDRSDLFNDMIIPWLKSEPLLQTLLASHLCSLFMSVENKDFLNRLPNPSRYDSSINTDTGAAKSADIDPQFIKKSQFIDDVNAILDYYELKNSPHLTQKRVCVIKWMAAVAVELATDRLEQFLPNFLPLLCREESNGDNSTENEVLVLTKQVLQLFKNIIGTEKFSEFYTKARTELTLKRLDRKKSHAIQSVNDVMKSSKRKIEKHNKNKISKKRKHSNLKSKFN